MPHSTLNALRDGIFGLTVITLVLSYSADQALGGGARTDFSSYKNQRLAAVKAFSINPSVSTFQNLTEWTQADILGSAKAIQLLTPQDLPNNDERQSVKAAIPILRELEDAVQPSTLWMAQVQTLTTVIEAKDARPQDLIALTQAIVTSDSSYVYQAGIDSVACALVEQARYHIGDTFLSPPDEGSEEKPESSRHREEIRRAYLRNIQIILADAKLKSKTLHTSCTASYIKDRRGQTLSLREFAAPLMSGLTQTAALNTTPRQAVVSAQPTIRTQCSLEELKSDLSKRFKALRRDTTVMAALFNIDSQTCGLVGTLKRVSVSEFQLQIRPGAGGFYGKFEDTTPEGLAGKLYTAMRLQFPETPVPPQPGPQIKRAVLQFTSR